jgi:predicted DCC family thiol-disulfide oxidoreductase YuxK
MGSSDQIKSKPVILFDGLCNLCNQSVQFIIRKDPSANFRFTALQSPLGQQLLTAHHVSLNKLYSVVLIKNNKVYQRSSAALEIARQLTGLWPLFYAFIIVPPFIRNAVYDWIARNRYRWFGKRDECMIPTPELKSRFLN